MTMVNDALYSKTNDSLFNLNLTLFKISIALDNVEHK